MHESLVDLIGAVVEFVFDMLGDRTANRQSLLRSDPARLVHEGTHPIEKSGEEVRQRRRRSGFR